MEEGYTKRIRFEKISNDFDSVISSNSNRSNSKTWISFVSCSHEGHNERLILEPYREVEIRWKIVRPLQKSSWWSSNQSENETKERWKDLSPREIETISCTLHLTSLSFDEFKATVQLLLIDRLLISCIAIKPFELFEIIVATDRSKNISRPKKSSTDKEEKEKKRNGRSSHGKTRIELDSLDRMESVSPFDQSCFQIVLFFFFFFHATIAISFCRLEIFHLSNDRSFFFDSAM